MLNLELSYFRGEKVGNFLEKYLKFDNKILFKMTKNIETMGY